jgi:hypothetical protein
MRRWLGSRRVYTKILIVAAVAIAGTAATGIFSLAGIAGLSGTRNDEVGNSVPYITALNKAALTARRRQPGRALRQPAHHRPDVALLTASTAPARAGAGA